MKKIRIKIEIECEDCTGYGFIPLNQGTETLGEVTCSGCDGTGYQTEYLTLAGFKELLESKG